MPPASFVRQHRTNNESGSTTFSCVQEVAGGISSSVSFDDVFRIRRGIGNRQDKRSLFRFQTVSSGMTVFVGGILRT